MNLVVIIATTAIMFFLLGFVVAYAHGSHCRVKELEELDRRLLKPGAPRLKVEADARLETADHPAPCGAPPIQREAGERPVRLAELPPVRDPLAVPLQADEFVVNVNGARKIFNAPEITYEQAVELAGRNPGTHLWSVTYSHRSSGRHGMLVPGQKTKALPGMYFNCMDTSGA